jgi:hypothetical protein
MEEEGVGYPAAKLGSINDLEDGSNPWSRGRSAHCKVRATGGNGKRERDCSDAGPAVQE